MKINKSLLGHKNDKEMYWFYHILYYKQENFFSISQVSKAISVEITSAQTVSRKKKAENMPSIYWVIPYQFNK